MIPWPILLPCLIDVIIMFMQGQGDGALPMLASATDPAAASGDFYCPSVVGVIGMVRASVFQKVTV